MAETPDDLRKEVQRAEQAKSIIESPLFGEAFDSLRADYLKAWQATQTGQTDIREKLYFAMKTLDAVKGHFESVMSSGKLAEAQLRMFEEKVVALKRK